MLAHTASMPPTTGLLMYQSTLIYHFAVKALGVPCTRLCSDC